MFDVTKSVETTNSEINARFELLRAVAQEAGLLAKGYFLNRHELLVEHKGVQDFVSVADRACETLIIDRLRARFPEDSFLGEEGGASGPETTYLWVIDPIDGTANFLRGTAFWCVSIALVRAGEVVAGVVHDPVHDEMFAARIGAGATCNGKPIHVSKTIDPTEGRVALGFSYRRPVDLHVGTQRRMLEAHCEYRFMGAGALSMAHVAAGRFDGYWEAHINSWDVLAGLLLVREAGGWANDFLADDGLRKGNEILAATPGLAGFLHKITGGTARPTPTS